MDSKTALINFPKNPASRFALGGLMAGAIMLTSALATAQDAAKTSPPRQPGFFGTLKGWWDQTTDTWNAGVSGVQKRFETFGHDAGVAARTTVDTARDAADAAIAMCKAKGFEGGTSLDMTTAEVCPAQVYLSGRSAGEGCHTETFVSRVLCK